MQLVFPIAVKPYVKKFIAADYDVDPFVLYRNNPYGLFLYNCLQKPPAKIIIQLEDLIANEQLSPQDVNLARLIVQLEEPKVCHELRRNNIYSEQMLVQISQDFWDKKGCIITEMQQYHFNKFVAYMFHDALYKYVKHRLGVKGSINKAILNFRELYGISEDELSFKTIQRAFQRRQQARN
jgi:hypothetical protein